MAFCMMDESLPLLQKSPHYVVSNANGIILVQVLEAQFAST